jgi:hypothetical protein
MIRKLNNLIALSQNALLLGEDETRATFETIIFSDTETKDNYNNSDFYFQILGKCL